MVSTAASQRQGPGFNSGLRSLPVWSLHVLPVSTWVSFGCSGFPSQSKDVQVRLIGHAKLTRVSWGVSRVNMWSYGDTAWVRLCSVQTRWAKWPPSAL